MPNRNATLLASQRHAFPRLTIAKQIVYTVTAVRTSRVFFVGNLAYM